MKIQHIKRLIWLALLIVWGIQVSAQQKSVKLGENATIISSSAILELEASNKGILFSRVALTGLLDVSTVPNAAHSLIVFNTATTSTGTNDVQPGYYYRNVDAVTPANTRWVRITDANTNVQPFKVENTTFQANSNTQSIYQNGNVGIGDFSATPISQKLDVDGTARIRTLTNANTLPTTYSRTVLADANGNLGYRSNPGSPNPWLFNDAQSVVIPAKVTVATAGTSYTPLDMTSTVTIPANTRMKIAIAYNVPSYYNKNNGTIQYIGCTLYKTQNAVTTEVVSGSRKYSTMLAASAPAGVTQIGMFIDAMTTEEITNNTTLPITVTYFISGYLETNANTGVNFGMWDTNTANPQQNWGIANMTIQSFYQNL